MIALAQIMVADSLVEENVRQHSVAISTAARHGAKLVIFPELSLHGYVLESAKHMSRDDKTKEAIAQLHKLAIKHDLTAVVGAFIEDNDQCYISSFILGEASGIRVYYKQFLHAGEEQHISAGSQNVVLTINGLKIGLGICADFTEPNFFDSYRDDNVDLLLMSVLISAKGYGKDLDILTKQSNLTPIAFANFVGKSGGWDCCGRSTLLHLGQKLVSVGDEEQLIFIDVKHGFENITSHVLRIE